jgi:hypothetical protein
VVPIYNRKWLITCTGKTITHRCTYILFYKCVCLCVVILPFVCDTPCGVHPVIAFQYGFASMTFDEVIRNSRSIPNWNWSNNFLSFPERNRTGCQNWIFLLRPKLKYCFASPFPTNSIKSARPCKFYWLPRKSIPEIFSVPFRKREKIIWSISCMPLMIHLLFLQSVPFEMLDEWWAELLYSCYTMSSRKKTYRYFKKFI